ncbi:hypothetical protein HanIR_Chr03g0144141 [Helianthus annuus]|nr:hypothetical protein HanIR_Chr03g0144141 [Helianthus annuus]
MDGGVTAEQGTVTCATWIRRPENAHLVALGKSKHGNLPASLQIFIFSRITNSLTPSPSATFCCLLSVVIRAFWEEMCRSPMGAGEGVVARIERGERSDGGGTADLVWV